MSLTPQTWTPGVHLEQALRRPAPLLETGVPVFLGRLSVQGRSVRVFDGEPLVTPIDRMAWSSLEASTGTAWAEGALGFAVRGFFENGGRRCFIVHLKDGLDASVLEALDAMEGFDLVCAPGLAVAEQTQLVQFFSGRSRCFLILDSPRAGITASTVPPALRSPDAAMYTPWLKVPGACGTCAGTGRLASGTSCSECWGSGQGLIPPSGHVAGIYARTDHQGSVHKTPANEVLEGVIDDLATHLDDRTVAQLNAQGINCLRAFRGRGIRVWGARTLAPQSSSLAFVNARRTLLTVARWLELTLADTAFEPNNLQLWVRINRDVGNYLEQLHRRGALVGVSAAEAFYVKCDAETNPPSVRERGQVVTEIGLALALPSEFIVVQLVSGTSGTSVAGVTGAP